MRKVQQKQWQIFCGKVLWKLVRLENQGVTIDPLFPFNGAGGFGADVVDYTVDSVDFVDDAIGKGAEQFIGQMRPVGCHAVDTGDGTNGDYVFVGARISHNANGLDRE